MGKDKVVLAYSGGLDTTVIIPWLKENFDYDVICCCVNCGQGAELEGLDERAKLSGASKLYIEDIVDEFCEDYIMPCVQAGAVYEHKYLLGTSMARPGIAKKLVEIAKGYVKEIIGKTDHIVSAGYSTEEAQASTQAFEKYVTEHRDEIEALRLIYNELSGLLTRTLIDDLAKRLHQDLPGFNSGRLWNDYALLNPGKVKPLGKDIEAVTNLIQLVSFAYKTIDNLYSLTSTVAQRFELWYGQAQRTITPEQKELFRKIAGFVAQNGGCDFDTLSAVVPEYVHGMRQFFASKTAANAELYSLNEFILKAA